MKLQIVTALIVLSSVISAKAVTFGKLELAGKGCANKTAELVKVSEEDSTYSIALNIKINKTKGSMERKACNATLPVTLEAGEKLLIENISQNTSAEVARGGSAQAQIEVFIAGEINDVLKTEYHSNGKKQLTMNGVVSESDCGGAVNVRANASAVALGSGKITLNQEDLKLNLRVIKCTAK